MKNNSCFLYSAIILTFVIMLSGSSNAKLSEETLKDKKTGWYITGLPLINYASDDGTGYGARLYFYYNGKNGDKYFDESPYFLQVYAQFYTTTKGFSYHELNFDKYNIFGTKYRIKSAFVYERRINANFYGIGSNITKNNLIDINGNEYSTYDDYESFLKSSNYEYFKYNKYEYKKPAYWLDFFGDITGPFKFLAGFEIKYADIVSWQNKRFEDEKGNDHVSETTLLDLSKDSIKGYNGGWTNSVRLGAAFDTLDYAPDPGKGFYVDYSFKASHEFTGSDYNYYRSTIGARSYITVFRHLVIAMRAGYTDTSGGTPFYEMQYFDFLFDSQQGLGGYRTLRGYPLNRFVGETMTLGNIELRFKFAEITPFRQRFAFKLIAFADTGNVYDKAFEPFTYPGFGNYRYSYGGGLVVAWNLATIIHAYYGISPETTSVSINFNHSI